MGRIMTEAAPRTVYLRTEEIPLERLTPFPGNAKRGAVDKIRESVREHGQYRSLVVRHTSEDTLVVLAGNHTLLALQGEGHPHARCEIIACDDTTARKINVADNRLPELGTYDDDALSLILESLDGDFTGTGFETEDFMTIQALLAPPSSLEDLEEEYGEPENTDLRLTIRIKVTPEQQARFRALTDGLAEDDTGRFLALLKIAGRSTPV